jgi:hypothetical protein
MEIFWTVEQEQLSGLASPDPAQLAESSITQAEEWGEFIAANDFVLIEESRNCWMIRVSDISTLEACGNYTRVHLSCAAPVIRRPLRERLSTRRASAAPASGWPAPTIVYDGDVVSG